MAKTLEKPRLVVSHQSVSGWLKGTRHPTVLHQRFLATILQVPLEEVNHACEQDVDRFDVPVLCQYATIVVRGAFKDYEYELPIREGLDTNKVAVYKDWTAIFGTKPAGLRRHVRNVKADLFGWIPACPLVEHQRCLVPIRSVPKRVTLRVLDSVESSQRRVWFVYLPGGELNVGIGYRDRRSFCFTCQVGHKMITTSYRFSRVELVGHFDGRILFHLAPIAHKNLGAQLGIKKREEVVH